MTPRETLVFFIFTLVLASSLEHACGDFEFLVGRDSRIPNGHDGRNSAFMNDKDLSTYSHTRNAGTTNAFWYVDLGVSDQFVNAIRLYAYTGGSESALCNYRLITAQAAGACASVTGTYANEGVKIGVATGAAASFGDLWTGATGAVTCEHITTASRVQPLATGSATYIDITCPAGTAGRYIWVQLIGANRILHLNEVKADFGNSLFDTRSLVGKTASQSSTYSDPDNGAATASKGIDDLTTGGSSQTNSGTNAWWQVDLGEVASVYKMGLVMSPRGNSAEGYWWLKVSSTLSDFADSNTQFTAANEGTIVGVSNTPCSGTSLCGGTTCAVLTSIASSAYDDKTGTIPISCPHGTKGRYVYVQAKGASRYVQIKELRVAYSDSSDSCGCYADFGFRVAGG